MPGYLVVVPEIPSVLRDTLSLIPDGLANTAFINSSRNDIGSLVGSVLAPNSDYIIYPCERFYGSGEGYDTFSFMDRDRSFPLVETMSQHVAKRTVLVPQRGPGESGLMLERPMAGDGADIQKAVLIALERLIRENFSEWRGGGPHYAASGWGAAVEQSDAIRLGLLRAHELILAGSNDAPTREAVDAYFAELDNMDCDAPGGDSGPAMPPNRAHLPADNALSVFEAEIFNSGLDPVQSSLKVSKYDKDLDRVLEEMDNGIIVCLSHIGLFVPAILSIAGQLRGRDIAVFYDEPSKNPGNQSWDNLAVHLREYGNVIHNNRRGIANAIKILRKSGVCIMMPDLFSHRKGRLFVPVCGKIWPMYPGTGWLAEKTGADIIYLTTGGPASGTFTISATRVDRPQSLHDLSERSRIYIRMLEIARLMTEDFHNSEYTWAYECLLENCPASDT